MLSVRNRAFRSKRLKICYISTSVACCCFLWRQLICQDKRQFTHHTVCFLRYITNFMKFIAQIIAMLHFIKTLVSVYNAIRKHY